jgi:VWFA-related protein
MALLATTLVTAQQTQRPTFRSTTDVVTTEVIVRDSSGKFVPDLTINDFEVFEDGVPQKLTNFVVSIGGRIMQDIAPTAPVRREGLVLPPTRPATDQSGRIFIIFIDDMHLQASDSIKARQVLKQIRDTVIHDGDLIAIVSTGYSSIEVDLTYDYKRKRFDESIAKVMGSGMSPTEIINASQTSEGPAGLRHNAFVAFSTAYDMLAQVEKIPNRRKAFIYVSAGYDFNPFTQSRYKAMQDLYSTSSVRTNEQVDPGTTGSANNNMSVDDMARYRNPFDSGSQQFAESDLIAALAELTRTARRSNVTFYTVDPRGLIAGSNISDNLSADEFWKFVENSVSSLKVLGDETGGFCICNTNDFKKGLQKIDNEMSDYYMVGYVSSNPDPLKVRRNIEIRVKRPGTQKPLYRESYTIKR